MTDLSQELRDTCNYLRSLHAPTKIIDAEDIKSYHNSVLFSAAAGDEYLDRAGMRRLFQKPDDLTDWMTRYANIFAEQQRLFQQPDTWKTLPELERGKEFVRTYRRQTNEFGFVYNEVAVIVGKTENITHIFPSGTPVTFKRIVNEMTANVPITDLGYTDLVREDTTTESFDYYVRQTAIDFLLATFDIVKETAPYKQYSHQFSVLEEQIEGIVLAHEIMESTLFRNQEYPVSHGQGGAIVELLVEENEIPFLKLQGIPLEVYQLFHLLRAEKKQPSRLDRGISRAIVDASFQPRKAKGFGF